MTEAVAAGASLLALPECFNFIGVRHPAHNRVTGVGWMRGQTRTYSALQYIYPQNPCLARCPLYALLFLVPSKKHWTETVEAAEPLTGPSMTRYCNLAKVRPDTGCCRFWRW